MGATGIIFTAVFLQLLLLIFNNGNKLSYISLLFMWTLWGCNTWNGDYDAYKHMYEHNSIITGEFGYQLIERVFSQIGLGFEEYMIVYSFLSLLIIFFTIKNSPTNYNIFFFVYMIIFIQEYVYMRNYLATNLSILALVLYAKNNNKLTYVIIILTAASIHAIALINLIFIFALSEKPIDKKKIVFPALLLFIIFFLIPNSILPLLGTYFNSRIEYYVLAEATISNSIILHIILVIIILYVYEVVEKNSQSFDKNTFRFISQLRNVLLLSLFIIIFYIIVPHLSSRVLRYLFVISLLFFTSIITHFKSLQLISEKRRVVYSFIIFITIIILFLLKSTLPYTLYPLVFCNSLWGEENYVPQLID